MICLLRIIAGKQSSSGYFAFEAKVFFSNFFYLTFRLILYIA